MTEVIEQRGSELFVAEHLDPLREGQIAGDDGRAAFIALRQKVEQQLTASAQFAQQILVSLAAVPSRSERECDSRPGDEADPQGQELALRNEAAHRTG